MKRFCCVCCDSGDFRNLLTTAPVPVFQGCTDADESLDLTSSMEWVQCVRCGTAQLRSVPDPCLVYQGAHATGLGLAWQKHHAAFAQFIANNSRAGCLDVGGGSGKLAAEFRKIDAIRDWYILEPTPIPQTDALDVVPMRGFFDESFKRLPSGVRTVVFCHSLEHMSSVRDTVKQLGNVCDYSMTAVVAWPILEDWVSLGLAGAINFEHSFLCTIERLVSLFESSGFTVKGAVSYEPMHTQFIAFEKSAMQKDLNVDDHDAERIRHLVTAFYQGFRDRASRLSAEVEQVGPKGRTYLTPASVYSQYLIAFGLDQNLFTGLLDNAKLKQGMRLYGTHLFVKDPRTALSVDDCATVVLSGGPHVTEIAHGLRQLAPRLRLIGDQ